jgi:Holliday junction resolvase RusA-like endonuclease
MAGVVFEDDSQIVRLKARKAYTQGLPGVSIKVSGTSDGWS